MRNNLLSTVLLLVAVSGLAACNSAKSDWEKASTLNTVAAYQDFLKAHPNDERASEAQAMIAQQQDNDAFDVAKHEGTAAGYQTYLEKFPQGAHAASAKTAMMDINRAMDWKSAQNGDAVAVQNFLSKYPTGTEVAQAKERLEALTGFRVRFSSDSSESRAKAAFAKLKAKIRDQVSDLEIVNPDAHQKFYSVESGGRAEEAAKALCDGLKKKSVHCMVHKVGA